MNKDMIIFSALAVLVVSLYVAWWCGSFEPSSASELENSLPTPTFSDAYVSRSSRAEKRIDAIAKQALDEPIEELLSEPLHGESFVHWGKLTAHIHERNENRKKRGGKTKLIDLRSPMLWMIQNGEVSMFGALTKPGDYFIAKLVNSTDLNPRSVRLSDVQIGQLELLVIAAGQPAKVACDIALDQGCKDFHAAVDAGLGTTTVPRDENGKKIRGGWKFRYENGVRVYFPTSKFSQEYNRMMQTARGLTTNYTMAIIQWFHINGCLTKDEFDRLVEEATK